MCRRDILLRLHRASNQINSVFDGLSCNWREVTYTESQATYKSRNVRGETMTIDRSVHTSDKLTTQTEQVEATQVNIQYNDYTFI